jgi:thioredoxin reductase (NADPH)
MDTYDVAIIGAGPAGLTAGIYCARYGLKTAIVEKALYGGTATLANSIQNWPGEKDISGPELMIKFKEHAQKAGAEFILNTVTEIDSKGKEKNVIMQGEEISAKTVIIAVGSKSKWLKVKGEKELLNRGIHFCATCDGPMYNGKVVAVVGHDYRAVEEAVYLSTVTKKVYLISDKKELTAEAAKQELIKGKNIEVLLQTTVTGFEGKDKLEKINIRNAKGKEEQLLCEAAFIYAGTEPNTDFVSVEKDKQGRIITDNEMKTSVSGIYAAGDCIKKELMQIITCAAEGAIAAHSVSKYIQEQK